MDNAYRRAAQADVLEAEVARLRAALLEVAWLQTRDEAGRWSAINSTVEAALAGGSPSRRGRDV
jgi:hypothetical protein